MAKTVEQYISEYPPEVQAILEKVRFAIQKSAPKAEERISYGMPSFYLEGPLVYFAACKNHLGFYPTASGIRAFQKELSKFNGAKGSVQFPYDRAIPIPIIQKIVRFRVEENLQKAEAKKKKKRRPSSAPTA